MVSEAFQAALGLVAPVYNLVLGLIIIFLFFKIFRLPNRLVYIKPWKVMFTAVLVYFVEEIITVLRKAGVVSIEIPFFNALLEMVIISLFIYSLLLQREYITTRLMPAAEKKPEKKASAKKVSSPKKAKKSSHKKKKKEA